MSDSNPTIQIYDDPEFGLTIRCKEVDEADALEDFLTSNDISDFSVRFLKGSVELFVPSVKFDRLSALVTVFLSQRGEEGEEPC